MADQPEGKKPRVFSGIQPTGRKTLGNYSGGFRQYVQTQEAGDAFFCIVDLHSISVEYDPLELRSSTLDRLLPESCDRARRGGVAAVGRRELRPVGPNDAVQGEVRPARVRLRRTLHVPGPDGG